MDLQKPFAILARIMVRIRALGEADVAQWEIESVACSFGRTRLINSPYSDTGRYSCPNLQGDGRTPVWRKRTTFTRVGYS
jgi:hypothetical protein